MLFDALARPTRTCHTCGGTVHWPNRLYCGGTCQRRARNTRARQRRQLAALHALYQPKADR